MEEELFSAVGNNDIQKFEEIFELMASSMDREEIMKNFINNCFIEACEANNEMGTALYNKYKAEPACRLNLDRAIDICLYNNNTSLAKELLKDGAVPGAKSFERYTQNKENIDSELILSAIAKGIVPKKQNSVYKEHLKLFEERNSQ